MLSKSNKIFNYYLKIKGKKMLKLSLLLFFIFCYLNLYSFDQVVIKKDISLKNELSNDVLNNVQFTDSKIYVLTPLEEGELMAPLFA